MAKGNDNKEAVERSDIKWGPSNPHPLSRMKTELVWEGKYNEYGEKREVETSGLALPMQHIEMVDEPRSAAERQGELFETAKAHRDDFRNRLIWGDNKLVMASLLRDFKGKVDLIYIDPPFDVDDDFKMNVPINEGSETATKDQSLMEQVAYKDTWGSGVDSYLAIMFERLSLMRELLSDKGSIYVHCDWRVSATIKKLLDEVFGENNFTNEIIWKGSAGDTSDKNKKFIKSHETIFLYRKTEKNFTWNDVLQEYGEGGKKPYLIVCSG
jgi:adenine specific DNA methylase Mod